jgi:hypothetical protein
MAASKGTKAIAIAVLEIKPSTVKTVVILPGPLNELLPVMNKPGTHTKITVNRRTEEKIITRLINVRRETFGYLFQRVRAKTMHPTIAINDGSSISSGQKSCCSFCALSI